MMSLILRHGASGVLGVVFSIIGTVSAAIAGGLAYDLHRDRAMHEHVTGTVVGQRRGNRSYRPVIQFESDGRVHELVGTVGNSSPVFEVGETVTVLVPPGHPQDARFDHWTESGFGILFGGFFTLVFGGIGLSALVVTVRAASGSRWAREQGVGVQARLVGVERDGRIRVNGRSPYRIVSQWQNPRDRKIYRFESEPMWFDPTPYLEGRTQVGVKLDPERPRRYWMDTGFLPETA